MGLATPRRARHVALFAIYGAIGAVLVIAAAVYAALWTPGTLDLSIRDRAPGALVVTWVVPDGPAWSAGVRPGATIARNGTSGRTAPVLVVRQSGQRIVLGPEATRVDPLDLLVAAVGLGLVLFGVVVLVKACDNRAARAFWWMSALIGLALGVVPAGFHGIWWAVALTFVALALFGPALLTLALVFPSTEAPPRYHAVLWLPALVLLAFYAVCWWRPAPLFILVSGASNILLAGYILAACARLGWVLRHHPSKLQQVQLRWLALGLTCGLLPLVGFNLLPFVVVGRDVVPPQASILALVLLPLSVGIAIVRTEVFGITGLLHRRALHALLDGLLLASTALVVGWLARIGPQGWGWQASTTAMGASALMGLGFLILRPWLRRRAELLFLRDVYDAAETIHQINAELAQAMPHTIGPLIVTRVCTMLNLDFALLLTADAPPSVHTHPRSPVSPEVLEAIACRVQALITASPPDAAAVTAVSGVPVLLLPIQEHHEAHAVLCCGPKHSTDCYTTQDEAVLHAIAHYLAMRLHELHLQAQLAEQSAILRALQDDDATEGEPLTRTELRVLVHVAQGLSNREIAQRLDRDTSTIEKHTKSIRGKLGARDSIAAVKVARRNGLLPPA